MNKKDFIPYNHYVHQHDEKIKAEYADRRTADIADEVQRNYYTVSRKAARLGVQKTEAFMRSAWKKGSRKQWAIRGEGRKRYKAAADAYMKEHFCDTANETLAQLFGVGVRTVRCWARRLGLQKSEAFMKQARAKGCCTAGPRPFYTSEQEEYRRQRVAEIYPNGSKEELKALAEELGIGMSSLKVIARRHCIRRSSATRKWKYSMEFIKSFAEYYPHHSNKDCAEHFGISKMVVHGLAQQYSMKKTHEQKAQSQRERRRRELFENKNL